MRDPPAPHKGGTTRTRGSLGVQAAGRGAGQRPRGCGAGHGALAAAQGIRVPSGKRRRERTPSPPSSAPNLQSKQDLKEKQGAAEPGASPRRVPSKGGRRNGAKASGAQRDTGPQLRPGGAGGQRQLLGSPAGSASPPPKKKRFPGTSEPSAKGKEKKKGHQGRKRRTLQLFSAGQP